MKPIVLVVPKKQSFGMNMLLFKEYKYLSLINKKMGLESKPQVTQEVTPTIEVVQNPKEEYGTVEDMFSIENLGDNFDMVLEQMNKLRKLIEKYNEVSEAYKTDLDMDQYVDEYLFKIEDVLRNFRINNKSLDIRKIANGGRFEDYYNDIVLDMNRYIENFMRGKDRDYLRQI